jgi:hypothetical protein
MGKGFCHTHDHDPIILPEGGADSLLSSGVEEDNPSDGGTCSDPHKHTSLIMIRGRNRNMVKAEVRVLFQ